MKLGLYFIVFSGVILLIYSFSRSVTAPTENNIPISTTIKTTQPAPKISQEYENFLLGKNSNHNLQKETSDAFAAMRKEALKSGITLRIVSGMRNFEDQKTIWNNKWEGKTLVAGKDLSQSTPNEVERFRTILGYSSVPGVSRHHWGTDIDINSVEPSYFNTKQGAAIYAWLKENAKNFGFCQPYNALGDRNKPVGFNEEKWHFTYLPLSKKFTEDYKTYITSDKIKGFDGDQYVSSFDLINDYLLNINPDCL